MTAIAAAHAGRWRRGARDVLLLPLALIVIVAEDVIWRGSRALLRGVAELPPVEATRRALARLSGWVALPLFLIPEAAGRVGEIWAAVLLYRDHIVSAVLVYALVRLLATLLAVFIWQACAPALLRLWWFARVVGWVGAARDWAVSRTAPLRARARALLRTATAGGAHGGVLRVQAMRRWVRARWRTGRASSETEPD